MREVIYYKDMMGEGGIIPNRLNNQMQRKWGPSNAGYPGRRSCLGHLWEKSSVCSQHRKPPWLTTTHGSGLCSGNRVCGCWAGQNSRCIAHGRVSSVFLLSPTVSVGTCRDCDCSRQHCEPTASEQNIPHLNRNRLIIKTPHGAFVRIEWGSTRESTCLFPSTDH